MGIVKDEKILGGKARLKGSRVSTEQVYEMYKLREMEPKKIADVLPTISLDEVREAIEYEKNRKKRSALSRAKL